MVVSNKVSQAYDTMCALITYNAVEYPTASEKVTVLYKLTPSEAEQVTAMYDEDCGEAAPKDGRS